MALLSLCHWSVRRDQISSKQMKFLLMSFSSLYAKYRDCENSSKINSPHKISMTYVLLAITLSTKFKKQSHSSASCHTSGKQQRQIWGQSDSTTRIRDLHNRKGLTIMVIVTVWTLGHSKVLTRLSAKSELICTAPQTIPHVTHVPTSPNDSLRYAVSQKCKTKNPV